MFEKKIVILLFIAVISLLSACSGGSTSEKIYNHLEKAVTLEEAFEKQQEEIVKLEKKEQKLYSQIIDLSMEEFDKIKSVSQDAIDTIEKRKELISLEKESIDASKKEFEEVKDLVGELEDEKAKEKANKMYDVMMNRYEAYSKLNQAYTQTLDLEKELYTLLQKEDLKQETLTAHIEKINQNYNEVLDANENFNSYTEKYNQMKKEFYEAADLKVKYEDAKQKEK
ncbi:YkyA family protein [Virgibacillus flavescens]|uniref:YkyA family protein n=1 Tax=Virgibacillus flavescens TaxID=1611422 RepID=UPI003D3468F7